MSAPKRKTTCSKCGSEGGPTSPCGFRGCEGRFCGKCRSTEDGLTTCKNCRSIFCDEHGAVYVCDDKYCQYLDDQEQNIHACERCQRICSHPECEAVVFPCCPYECTGCGLPFCEDHLDRLCLCEKCDAEREAESAKQAKRKRKPLSTKPCSSQDVEPPKKQKLVLLPPEGSLKASL